jgi:hypothetical protein
MKKMDRIISAKTVQKCLALSTKMDKEIMKYCPATHHIKDDDELNWTSRFSGKSSCFPLGRGRIQISTCIQAMASEMYNGFPHWCHIKKEVSLQHLVYARILH